MRQSVVVKALRGNKYVFLVEYTSHMKNGKKVEKSKNIKTFGRYKDLYNEDPDFLNKLKEKYNTGDSRNKALKVEGTIKSLAASNIDEKQEKVFSIDMSYSTYPLMYLWNEVLGLEKYLYRFHKSDKGIDFNGILSYMCSCLCLDPNFSKNLFFKYSNQICAPEINNLYDVGLALDFFYKHKNSIFNHIKNIYPDSGSKTKSLLLTVASNYRLNIDLYNEKITFIDKRDPEFKTKLFSTIKSFLKKVNDVLENFKNNGLEDEPYAYLIGLIIDSNGFIIDYYVFSSLSLTDAAIKRYINSVSNGGDVEYKGTVPLKKIIPRYSFTNNEKRIDAALGISFITMGIEKLIVFIYDDKNNRIVYEELVRALESALIRVHSSNGIDGYFSTADNSIDYSVRYPVEGYVFYKVVDDSGLSYLMYYIGLGEIKQDAILSTESLAESLKVKPDFVKIIGKINSEILKLKCEKV